MPRFRSRHSPLVLASLAAIAAAPLSSAVGQQPGAPVGTAVIEGATDVSPVTVTPLAPVPQVGAGAPYFAPEEIQSAVSTAERRRRDSRWARGEENEGVGVFGLGPLCSTVFETQNAVVETGEAAEAATLRALDARAAAARGEATAQTVAATELERQAAVIAFARAREASDEADARVRDLRALSDQAWGVFLPSEIERRTAFRDQYGAVPPAEYEDLRLMEVRVREIAAGGDTALEVSGRIVNTRPRAIPIPPLSIGLLDRGGFLLKTQEIQPDRGARIPAGGAVPFAFTMRPSPNFAMRATVTFGSYHQYPAWLSPDCQNFNVGPRRIGRPTVARVGGDVRQFFRPAL